MLNADLYMHECRSICFPFVVYMKDYACNMFMSLSFMPSALYVGMSIFMGLDAQMIWRIVASSSLVGGLGTLQCGIRALVVEWA